MIILASGEQRQCIYDLLAENHITCTKLEMHNVKEWNTEQCGELIKIIKPVDVEMYSKGFNRFEAI